jgi:translation initiation factor IF-1
METGIKIIASYNYPLYGEPSFFNRVVNDAVEALRPHVGKFDSIAFRGTSGAMIAPAVAAALGKHMTLVRKDDGHHEIGPISGRINMPAYIILDDLVATGNTVKAIQTVLGGRSPASRCVGLYLWGGFDEGLYMRDDEQVRPTIAKLFLACSEGQTPCQDIFEEQNDPALLQQARMPAGLLTY